MSIRDLLRGLPVFARPLPRFAPADTPGSPDALFVSWLAEAVDAGVVEPHAMTLSTVDGDGLPDTRVLLLKEVDDRGWQFATSAGSAKGRQVAGTAAAALGFYWREQGRQVRVRGTVAALDPQTSAADFRARPVSSRVASLASEQSAVLADPPDLERALATAEAAVAADPDTPCADHTVYAVTPTSVEFWQGDADRRHVRLRYRRSGDTWHKELLWP
ncbi:pyridoxine/pyridoxamine 5'-phosphate oxidase [Asanoa ishikariensis]|uniref:pyridoxine/pyridoxamine 5'-phosphate oxidase n=1 Tax=Asanoa ishikariensis TaxID=137265 RepID=UPI001EF1B707|nr:pyridoxal 5'-phosphate synthase [Asanoa ishikariensis]